eukprot:RCo033604
MSTNLNVFFPPAIQRKSVLALNFSNSALRHDLIRLAMVCGAAAYWFYICKAYGDRFDIARFPGKPVVMKPWRGFNRIMPWLNDCHLLGDEECWAKAPKKTVRLFTF